ncbi:MAG: hypothetical protein ACLGHT_12640 [Acidimicrobiia bacterium]
MPRRRIVRLLALAAVIALAVITTACAGGGDDDSASGQANNAADSSDDKGGGDDSDDDAKVSVSGDGDDGKVKIETKDGTFEGGSGAELPDDFPDDFPMPDDAEVQFAGSQSGDDGDAMTVIFKTKEPAEDVYEFYVEELENEGYDVSQTFSGESDGNFGGTLAFTNSDYEGAIGISEDPNDGTTGISLTLNSK